MNVRRPISVALALLLGHLNMARADAACAEGDAHQPVTAESSRGAADHARHVDADRGRPKGHAGHAGHEIGSAAGHVPAGPEECESPATPECCQALAACSVTGDVAASAGQEPVTVTAAWTSGVRVDVPHSRVTAPEPPPPRA